MRFALLFASAALVASAADSLVGDWKVKPERSTAGVTAGRALIEPSSQGGYLQFSETFFSNAPVLRFNGIMRDGSAAEDAQFNDHPVRYTSRKTGASTFELNIMHPNTGAAIKTVS